MSSTPPFTAQCEFTEVNKELLAKLPAPEVAVKYYNGNDLYYFDEFQARQHPRGEILPTTATKSP